jgi:uncharacterized membrane protein
MFVLYLEKSLFFMGWNILDFLIVVLGIVSLFVDGSFTSLRAVRVLRFSGCPNQEIG